MSDQHLTQTRFDSFSLDERILAGLSDAGFTHCTPIQALTLPLALAGRDVAGQAQTGTGKTAAFLLVLMQRLLASPVPEAAGRVQPRALVLAPTRELAVQIHRDAVLLGGHTGLRTAVVYGGTGYQSQRDELAAGVDILIGTPGRLIDYLRQKVFDLAAIEAVVLDEADRMFDLGFIKDIRFLLRRMPPRDSRQGLLFSATLSYRVTELAYEHMNDPQRVEVAAEQVTAERVRQCCYMTANEDKVPLLIGLLRSWPDARTIVFVNTKRAADLVWGYLKGNGINAAVLSGDVPQPKRLALLHAFTEGELPVLVGTDVAARGLHIPDVTHVVNYDLPEDPEDYVHRIGRTARAGATGDAISFVCETYAFCLPDIEQYIGEQIAVQAVASELLAEVDPGSRVRPARADRQARREDEGREGGRRSRPRRTDDERVAAPRSPRPAERAAGAVAGDDRRARGTPIEVPDMPRIREQPIAVQAALTAPLKARPTAPVNASPGAAVSEETANESTGAGRRRRRARKPRADAVPADAQSGPDRVAQGRAGDGADEHSASASQYVAADPTDSGVAVSVEPSH